jgi:hypothetical protein
VDARAPRTKITLREGAALGFFLLLAVLTVLFGLFGLPLVFQLDRPTRVVIVNAGPEALADVSVRVECDGEVVGACSRAVFGPGDSWEVDVRETSMMPLVELAWREGDREVRHWEATDLWIGETWRIELLPGARVRSGYWREKTGWVTESERPAGKP